MLRVTFLCVALLCVFAKANIIVETNSGKIEGLEVKSIIKDEKYYSFLGIPYAQPPVGELRFKPPQPHLGWNDVLKTKKEKKSCAQFYLPVRQTETYGHCGDEDCLYLSIHTPKIPKEENLNMPVIVFLYNENFKISYNASKEYGPDFFMKEEVIFVTINHRIGTFGFVSFQDEIIPGNNGIKDIILGLKWIQNNIHKFGGDQYRITLMGNDGGAALVDLLLLSPKAKGLFSGAILQSGTAWNSLVFTGVPKEKAIGLAKALEKTITSSSQFIADLADVSALQITEAELTAIHTDDSRIHQLSIFANTPVVEPDHPDAVITKRPEDTTIDIDIPVMIGYTSREAIDKSERLLRKPQYLTFADRDFMLVFPINMGYRFEINTNVYYEAIQEIKDFYFDEGYVKISRPGEYMTYIGDALSFYPIDYAVRKYTNSTNTPVYYYTFDYSGEFNMRKNKAMDDAVTIEGTWGATTGDELCYLLVCKPIRKAYLKAMEDEDSEEIKVLRNMVRMWTNFAKTGNPTPDGDPITWTPATKENKECLIISDELQIKKNLHSDRIKFWDDFLAKYKEKAVNGVIHGDKDEL